MLLKHPTNTLPTSYLILFITLRRNQSISFKSNKATQNIIEEKGSPLGRTSMSVQTDFHLR